MDKYQEIATQVLTAVGGKENVLQVTHCVTRLRFNLKDDTIPNDEEIKALKGIMGIFRIANQYQVLIGTDVVKVYPEIIRLTGGEAAGGEVPEMSAQNTKKGPLTLRKIGTNILDYLSGSLTPLIPMLIGAAMLKSLIALLGPDMLGVMSSDSDIYILFTFASDAAFYFFPIIVGGYAAKKLGCTPVLGMSWELY